jgi:excisionase family DNA binding protein
MEARRWVRARRTNKPDAADPSGLDRAEPSGGTPAAGLRTQELLSVEQLSQWLQVPKQTVYRWRSCGGGPRGFRIGRHVRYAASDVRDWLDTQRDT